jgi:hypothetical protein
MTRARDTADLSTGIDVDSSGNVGIGTSSPEEKLHVQGSLKVDFGSAGGNPRVYLDHDSATDDGNYLQLNRGDDGLEVIGQDNVKLRTNGTERMRIDSSGNLLVGTTSPTTTGVGGATFYPTSFNRTIFSLGSTTTLPGAELLWFYNPNGKVGRIETNANSTSYVTTSDYRLKTDVQQMTGASARVQALNPVNFEWLSDGSRVDGFLAHEAQEVAPEAVSGTKDAMRDEEYEVTAAIEATYDDDGNELTPAVDAVMGTRSVPDYQGIDQSKLVPLLTAALQEALAKIDTMETRLSALEGA